MRIQVGLLALCLLASAHVVRAQDDDADDEKIGRAAPQGTAAVHDFAKGLNVVAQRDDLKGFAHLTAQTASQLGIKWVRLEMRAPDKAEQITVEQAVKDVEHFLGMGLNVLVLTSYRTISAPTAADRNSYDYVDKLVDHTRLIVQELKRKGFGGDRLAFEIWNEPDLAEFSIQPEFYAALLSGSQIAIKAADPKYAVVFAGLTVPPGNVDPNYDEFFEKTVRFLKDPPARPGQPPAPKPAGPFVPPFDDVAIHIYPWTHPPEGAYEPVLRDWWARIRKEAPRARMWVTEYGYNAFHGGTTTVIHKDTPLPADLEGETDFWTSVKIRTKYKAWCSQAVAELKRLSGAYPMGPHFWFCETDFTLDKPEDPVQNFGLFRNDGNPTEYFEEFAK